MKRNMKRVVPKNSTVWTPATEPDYLDLSALEKFMSERGKILPRSKTGLSSKQQRAVTTAIKRARHLALLPYLVRV